MAARITRTLSDQNALTIETLMSFGFKQKNCLDCGAALFWALPGQVSRDDIVEFAKLIGNAQIAADGWIHPGVYCPNGCTTRLFNFGNQDFKDRLESNRKARETASIIVGSSSERLSNFKIYLDRNIRRTALRDTAPQHSEYMELEPGDHTIVIRDLDPHDPNRRESNTINFDILKHKQIVFDFSIENGILKLKTVG